MKIEYLYRDSEIVAINKPCGVPVQPDHYEVKDIQTQVSEEMGSPYHLINRIDRPVSGIVLLASSPKSMKAYQSLWQQHAVQKDYLAIAQGHLEEDNGILINRLYKGANNKAYVVPEPQGKRAALDYQVVERLDRYTIVKVSLHSGRFHQIRCQLAHIGHPVGGDVKYGARRRNVDRSIHLHSWKLFLPDREIVAPVPERDNLWKAVRESLIEKGLISSEKG